MKLERRSSRRTDDDARRRNRKPRLLRSSRKTPSPFSGKSPETLVTGIAAFTASLFLLINLGVFLEFCGVKLSDERIKQFEGTQQKLEDEVKRLRVELDEERAKNLLSEKYSTKNHSSSLNGPSNDGLAYEANSEWHNAIKLNIFLNSQYIFVFRCFQWKHRNS